MRKLKLLDDPLAQQFTNGIQLAAPCDQKWEKMRGDERVRHCDACAMNVYNLQGMKAVEIQALFVESEGKRVCGRVFRRKDGTVLTADCPVGLAEKAWRHARNGTLTAAASVLTLVAFLIAGLAAFTSRGPTPEPRVERVIEKVIDTRDELLEDREQPMPGGMLPPPDFDRPHVEPTP